MGIVGTQVRASVAAGRWHGRGWRLGAQSRRVAALTEDELVVLRGPREHRAHTSDVDLLVVSRPHLTGLSVAGSRLRIHADTEHEFVVGHAFARKVFQELRLPQVQPVPLTTQGGVDGILLDG
jgi:hypothetical protein